MKLTHSFIPAVVAAALVLGGCSSPGTRDSGTGAAGAGVEDRTGGAVTTGIGGPGTWDRAALNDPNSLLYTKTIYFDFDQSTIRSEFVEVLRAHANYLNRNLSATVLIEGHADERGSREYNIGLGERRANAIKRFLEAEGVSEVQISTISYGEERPVAFGQDEASWAQNRRGVLVY